MKLSDKQKQTIKKLKSIDSSNDFFWDSETGIAKFIKGKLSKPSNDETMLALLGTEIQGNWQLKVVDTVSRDTGTLNSWGIH